MSYPELIAAATLAIFTTMAMLKQAIPWLNDGGSRYVPLFALALGIGVAVYCGFHYVGLNWFEVMVSAIVPTLASSGVNSNINNIKGI
jgi:hypothetical protein